jgi:serine protease Do
VSRALAGDTNPEQLLDDTPFNEDCTFEERADYEDPLYVGMYDVYKNCGRNRGTLIQLAAVPEDESFIALLQVIAVTDADLDALDRILDTFEVVGDLP